MGNDFQALASSEALLNDAGYREDTPPNYLALHDAAGPSGVPLVGIGVGAIDLAPDGHFTRFAINN
jgi:non-lysosomal glucosylceramidase